MVMIQREIFIKSRRREAYINVHLWSPDDGYYIDNENEFAERLESQSIDKEEKRHNHKA